jgi:DHA2 family multidrug resistance protein
MHAVDTTIANVALPHIQGSMAATQEQMSWLLTSYIVAAAVMTPLTAWISDRIGRKRFFLISIAAFTCMSLLCGMSQSLSQIVIFRVLQGLSGAALIPLSQAILLDINPPERHGRAMSLWVMSTTLGPIFGAPLGAWITEYLGWRWVFYINLPIGAYCLFTLSRFLPETQLSRRSFDFLGFVTLSIATVCVQLVLDRGQLKDWLSSTEICIEVTIAAVAVYLFAVHSATTRESFINFRVFEDRNYAVGSAFGLILSILVIGPLVLTTSLLQVVMQYPVITAGMLAGSRGIGVFVSTYILGPITRHFDPRVVIAVGFGISAVALTQMCRFNLLMHYDLIFWSSVLFGFGIGTVSVSLTTVMFATLPPQLRTEGAALMSLFRNIGGSVGIAFMQTVLVRKTYMMHARLAEHVTPYSTHVEGSADLSNTAGLVAMNGRVAAQATMLAYINVYKMMLVLTLAAIPLAFLLSKPRKALIAEEGTTEPGVG